MDGASLKELGGVVIDNAHLAGFAPQLLTIFQQMLLLPADTTLGTEMWGLLEMASREVVLRHCLNWPAVTQPAFSSICLARQHYA